MEEIKQKINYESQRVNNLTSYSDTKMSLKNNGNEKKKENIG